MADRQTLTRALLDFERGRKIAHLSPHERENLVEGMKRRIAEINVKIQADDADHHNVIEDENSGIPDTVYFEDSVKVEGSGA